jgi:holo-[acyl-carrier protein] synthase
MRIIGIGLDATEIPRIDEAIARYGDRFLNRVFTDGEIAYCRAHRRAGQHFAARFAVKEAAMKALGTGHANGVLWRHVEVVRRGGPPQLQLHGAAARRFEALGGRSSVVTITHTDALAIAQVILTGD